MADAPHERRRHLDERAQAARWPGPAATFPYTASGPPRVNCNRSSSALMRAFSEATRNASSSMSMASARGTPIISAASARTPDPVPTSSTASGGAMPTSSSSTSRHSAVVGCSPVPNAAASINWRAPASAAGVSRNNRQTSDANRAWAEDPHGSRVAPRGRRHGDIARADAERTRDLVCRDAVGHEGRDLAMARALGINRAELDEPIERIVGDVADVYAVRHASA